MLNLPTSTPARSPGTPRDGLRAEPGPPPGFVNKLPSPRLFSRSSARMERLWEKLFSLQSLKYLLSDSLQTRLPALCQPLPGLEATPLALLASLAVLCSPTPQAGYGGTPYPRGQGRRLWNLRLGCKSLANARLRTVRRSPEQLRSRHGP